MPPTASSAEFLMYVGTYTRETSAGIYAFRFNPSSGTLEELGLVAKVRDPSFLALHPSGRYLYATNETDDYDSDGSGAVSSFAIDPDTGSLRLLNQVSSKGGWPCHLSVDASGRMVIVANYKGGSIAAFPIDKDGTLGEASSFFQHVGRSIHNRQEQAHAHSADFSLDNRFAFFSDLGLDQVKVYRADAETAKLVPNEPPYIAVAPGSGPRHFAQHPSGRFAYGLNELASTVSVYSFDTDIGTLTTIQTISTLPPTITDENYTAEIYVHPSGKFVYASNRGDDTITVFQVDTSNGKLERSGRFPTLGAWPRNFAIDPTGGYLLVANQNTDSIAIFQIDQASGALDRLGLETRIDAPVCILFCAAKRPAPNH